MKKEQKNKKLKKTLRYIFSAIGICISSLGVSFLLFAQLGSGPFDAFNFYMSEIYQSTSFLKFLDVGNTVVFHSTLITFLIVAIRRKIKYFIYLIPGALFGFVLNFWMVLLENLPSSEVLRWCLAPLGVITLALGITVGALSNAMMSPYDGFGWLIHDYIIKNMSVARFLLEGFFFLLALLLCMAFNDYSQIGIFTFVIVGVLGFIVKFMIKYLSKLRFFKFINE